MQQLTNQTVSQLADAVIQNDYVRADVGIGIVHLGPGAFHRAHQAVFTDNALALGGDWAICGVSMRSRGVRDNLAEQDNLYTLAILDEQPAYQLVGAIKEVLVLGDQREQVMQRLTAATTHIISLTVTEKGYCLNGDGLLDNAHADIQHDIANLTEARSAIGLIVAALQVRHSHNISGLTVISCDNLADNGSKLEKAVVAFAAQIDQELADWISHNVCFPNTMVDSITPATDEALKQRVADALGLVDNWPIQREAFTQWVIEDHFSGPRPHWEQVGVTFTQDVSGFEKAKLRLLNGSHSTLAYLGLRCGFETVHQGISNPALKKLISTMLLQEVQASFTAPDGMNVEEYIHAILARYGNSHIRHLLSQIAWDGSQKLPFRLLGTIKDNLAAGNSIKLLCTGVAAWLHFLVDAAHNQKQITDPLADMLLENAAKCSGDSADDVANLLAISQVFPAALAQDERFSQPVTDAYIKLAALNPQNVESVIESLL
ncbi:mannitol dehydrogenase family protein [Neptunicella marina]|uniref:Mannitol dehydrogenase family protein n=1 Tax=Neptunicella marina TaxID=2125989 RepID=A0A8J6IU62_9ALTE|nr:mannitol dehydrogenase family protein [Neptunicella marina]MBC3765686.1 mannitol dehydrogenase family protein [Neptunicella marina]